MRNIDRAQTLASTAGMSLRPHAKTHKSPLVAKWQIDRGAVGVCCAKVGEAEVFVDAGIGNIRLPYPVNPSNAARVLALADRAVISIIVDHPDVARGWSEAMQRAGRRLAVLIKVDVGFHRCGIDPDQDALGFVQRVAALPGLRLLGLLSHAGHGYHAASEEELSAVAQREAEILTSLRERAARAGIALDELSVGATPTLRFSAGQHGLTELRPGNYVTRHEGRIILDAGSKTLTNDQARGITNAPGYGAILTQDGSAIDATLTIERLSEEHATVRVTGSTALKPGDRVRVLPNHSCVVSNLVNEVRLVEDERVIDTLPVAARGRIQ